MEELKWIEKSVYYKQMQQDEFTQVEETMERKESMEDALSSSIESIVYSQRSDSQECAESELSECVDSEAESMTDSREVLDNNNILKYLSGLLFVNPKPISPKFISDKLKIEISEVEKLIQTLNENLEKSELGFEVTKIAEGFQLRTKVEIATFLKEAYPPKIKKISKAAAETLAVIAYKQPVTRSEIESIRGVDALPSIKTLIDSKLIQIVGHKQSIGQPALYATTEEFLEKFGLDKLSDLAQLKEITQIAEEVSEQLETTNDQTEELSDVSSSNEL